MGASFLQLTVVFHHGWEIDHPLETASRSLRLWPRHVGDSIDFAALPASTPNELRWVPGGLRVTFTPGAYKHAKPPALSSTPLDPMALAGQHGVTSVAFLGS
jgi:hypothetical protein